MNPSTEDRYWPYFLMPGILLVITGMWMLAAWNGLADIVGSIMIAIGTLLAAGGSQMFVNYGHWKKFGQD